MTTRADTDWFRDAGWGAFMHYLARGASAPGPAEITTNEWNRRIDAFDAAGLADQLQQIGAAYFFLTIGQNSGFYLSPNETYDSLVGRSPSRCSRRDLVADMIGALAGSGIRLMVYLPSHAPAHDRRAVEALKCTPRWDASAWQLRPGTYLREGDVDDRLSEFQRNWEAVIREWSLRWGAGVAGWWFDGCYHADRMYRCAEEPNFRSFAAAAKAGNPDSLVAFNPGVKVPILSLTEHEDYTAGEIANALPVQSGSSWTPPLGRFVDGAQLHVLTFLGEYWGRGRPRLPDELVVGYTKHVNAVEGVITWDVPPTPVGLIAEPLLRQLGVLRDATR